METTLNVDLLESIDTFAQGWDQLPTGVDVQTAAALRAAAEANSKDDDRGAVIQTVSFNAIAGMLDPLHTRAESIKLVSVALVNVTNGGDMAKIEEILLSPEARKVLASAKTVEDTLQGTLKQNYILHGEVALLKAQLKELEENDNQELDALRASNHELMTAKSLPAVDVNYRPIMVGRLESSVKNLQAVEYIMLQQYDMAMEKNDTLAAALWQLLGTGIASAREPVRIVIQENVACACKTPSVERPASTSGQPESSRAHPSSPVQVSN